eukprot:s2192_g2.t1
MAPLGISRHDGKPQNQYGLKLSIFVSFCICGAHRGPSEPGFEGHELSMTCLLVARYSPLLWRHGVRCGQASRSPRRSILRDEGWKLGPSC